MLQGQEMGKGEIYQGVLVAKSKEVSIRSVIDLIVRNPISQSGDSGRQNNLSFQENVQKSKQLEKLYTEPILLSFQVCMILR